MNKTTLKKYALTGAIALIAVAIANRIEYTRRLING